MDKITVFIDEDTLTLEEFMEEDDYGDESEGI